MSDRRRWRLRRRFSSWRVRLLGWMLLLVVISTAASIVTLRMVSLYQIERSVEADLRRAIDELEVLAGGNDPSTGEAFGTDVEAIFSTFLAANIPGEYETYVTFVDGELRQPDGRSLNPL